MLETTDHTLTVHGERLLARRIVHAAAGARRTIVFLHEALGCIPMWRDFPEWLCAATGSDGLVWDRLGHGGSDPLTLPRPFDFHTVEARDWLLPVLDFFAIERPVLFGHSDGGTIALLAAAEHPDRVEAVVSESAHVFVDDVTINGIEAAVREFRHGALRNGLLRFHGSNTDLVFRAWHETWLHPGFRTWSTEDRLPEVRCPILVIQGEDDNYGTLAQVESIVEKSAGPAESLVLPGAGHLPHRDQPDAIIDAVARFLDDLPAP